MTRDIDSPEYRDSNVGEGMIPPRSATPKPRAGEHVRTEYLVVADGRVQTHFLTEMEANEYCLYHQHQYPGKWSVVLDGEPSLLQAHEELLAQAKDEIEYANSWRDNWSIAMQERNAWRKKADGMEAELKELRASVHALSEKKDGR